MTYVLGSSGSAVPPAAISPPCRASDTSPNLRERLDQRELHSVAVLGPTHENEWRAHHVPAAQFLAATDATDGPAHPLLCALGKDGGEGTHPQDTKQPFLASHLIVDLTTLREAAWWPGTAVVLADAADSLHRPLESSPRRLLQDQIDHLTAMGFRLQVGVTTESVFAQPSAGTAPRPAGKCAGERSEPSEPEASSDVFEDFLVDLCRFLHRADLPVTAMATPGPGNAGLTGARVGTTFSDADALAASDGQVLFRLAARELASASGWSVRFTGTGRGDDPLHCVTQLRLALKQDGNDDATAFSQTVLDHAAGGLLNYLPLVALVCAMTADTDAPGTIIAAPGADHVATLTIPASAAGPYVALAMAVAGLVHGIRNSLPKPADAPTSFPLPDRNGDVMELLLAAPRASDVLGPEALRQMTSRGASRFGGVRPRGHAGSIRCPRTEDCDV